MRLFRNSISQLLLFLVCSLGKAWALATPEVSGRIFTNAYLPFWNNPNSQYQQIDTETWLTLMEKPSPDWQAKLTVVGQYEDRPHDELLNPASALQVREAYVNYKGLQTQGWDVKFGKILLPWGKTDGVNPTDYLSAKNFQISNWDPEVQRTGPVALVISETPNQGTSPFTITAVIAPDWARDRILLPPSLIPTGFTVQTPQSQSFTLGQAEAALKFSYSTQGWDASLSAFHGWNHLPDFGPSQINGSMISTTPAFHRVSTFGGDFSASLGSYVLRAEIAYRITEAQTAWLSPPSVDAVFGVERPVGDQFRIQLQGLLHEIPNFQPLQAYGITSPIDRGIAAANSVFQNYQFQTLPGATARFTFASEEKGWEAEIFALGYFVSSTTTSFSGASPGAELYVRPRITHEFFQGFKATLGLDHYEGPQDRPLGYSRAYSSVFLEGLYVL